jgi:hypothetical protein
MTSITHADEDSQMQDLSNFEQTAYFASVFNACEEKAKSQPVYHGCS